MCYPNLDAFNWATQGNDATAINWPTPGQDANFDHLSKWLSGKHGVTPQVLWGEYAGINKSNPSRQEFDEFSARKLGFPDFTTANKAFKDEALTAGAVPQGSGKPVWSAKGVDFGGELPLPQTDLGQMMRRTAPRPGMPARRGGDNDHGDPGGFGRT